MSPIKFQTPDGRELKINFVQGVLLQPDLKPVRQEVQNIPRIKNSDSKGN